MNKMPSVMEHNFSQVPQAEIPRSSFNRSHGLKTTFDAGYLIPIYVDEALPGDTFSLNMAGFGRLATPIFPIMDNLFLETFFFFVPNRLIWDNWKRFNGEQTTPGDSTDYTVPVCGVPAGGYPENSLFDYMGLPTKINGLESPNALHLRAYNLIYNQWFRDENLVNPAVEYKGNSPDVSTSYTLRKRGKRHDYFTSCLPWPQKGDAVSMPLGTQALIHQGGGTGDNIRIYSDDAGESRILTASTATVQISATSQPTLAQAYADLSDATAATINQLREAFQIQKLYERDARGGTRYTEIIQAHFGVTSPDARLQRAEYLGGGSTPLQVTEVPQTSSTDATTPQGNLAAFGTFGFNRHGFTKSFTEHGVIIGLANVRADLTYQQGLNRMWSRQTRWDYYWPALAHIGEQAVLSKEIYADGTANDQDVFGYQERFAEYRYKPSQVTGLFRSNAAASLDPWHLSQEFASRPTLSQTFIEESPPLDRVVAIPSQPDVILDTYFDLKCARPMPTYSIPGLIDHF